MQFAPLMQITRNGSTSIVTNSSSAPFFLQPSFWLGFFIVIILIVVLGLLLRFLALKILKAIKKSSMEKKSIDAVLFEVRVPRTNEVEIQSADQMFSGLLGMSESFKGIKKLVKARSFISYEIVGLPESIKFYVTASKNLANTLEKSINSAYPTAEVTNVPEYNIFAEGSKVKYAFLKLEKESYKPIRTYEDLATDSISSVLTTMSKLKVGEAVALQVVITGAGSEWRNQGKKYVEKVRSNNSDPEKKKMDVPEDLLSGIERKCEKGGFNVDIRLVSVAPDSNIAETALDSMISSFSQFAKEGSNYFKKVSLSNRTKREFIRDFVYRIPNETSVLNTAELATIMHFPNKNVDTPHINWLMSKRAPASAVVPSKGDLWLGTNFYRDTKKHIFIDRDDRRRHMYVIGKTGVGKSWFIQQMAYQDILKGEGIAFLDPHGDSAEWLLERIPSNRIEDVIYWNPGDTDRPIGFNIIEYFNEQDKHRTVNSFVGLMQKMFDPHNQGITGPRFERAVRNAMLTAMEREGSTLVEVLRILSDEKYAKTIIPEIKDDIVKRYWTDEMAQTQDFHKSEVLGYIVSKFDRFVTNKLTRNIFGQSVSGFNMRKIMDEGKILIVNLSKGIVGEENAQFLGLLLVPRILSAAMSRADIEEKSRRDFYLYVDEFQNFATNDFAQILSEARKYRLNLIVANQYISQMEDKIRDAVFGNVGTTVSMKVGSTDAQYLETVFTPIFDQTDLTNIENKNAYVKIVAKGESPSAFSISTDYKNAPFSIPKDGNMKVVQIVKNLSRLKYGRDRNLVETEMNERSGLSTNTSVSQGNLPPQAGSFNSPLKPVK